MLRNRLKYFLSVLAILFVASLSAKAETYVVCIGIANYASPKVKNLTTAENDAKSVASFFKKGTDNVMTITGKYATRNIILASLKSQFCRAAKGDKIIFYFSGHGYPGGFCPHDMTEISNGISFSEVASLMIESKASNKFIFADSCNSGGIRKRTSSKFKIGNVLFFLSSRDNELSNESSFMANGVFTKYLLKGLKGASDSNYDRIITAKELFDYVSNSVRIRTKDRQHPVMWGNFNDDTIIVEYKSK